MVYERNISKDGSIYEEFDGSAEEVLAVLKCLHEQDKDMRSFERSSRNTTNPEKTSVKD